MFDISSFIEDIG